MIRRLRTLALRALGLDRRLARIERDLNTLADLHGHHDQAIGDLRARIDEWTLTGVGGRGRG